jgi:hypothetical protein
MLVATYCSCSMDATSLMDAPPLLLASAAWAAAAFDVAAAWMPPRPINKKTMIPMNSVLAALKSSMRFSRSNSLSCGLPMADWWKRDKGANRRGLSEGSSSQGQTSSIS